MSVKKLGKILAFYQKATNFEVIERKTIRNNLTADSFFTVPNVELEVAILKSHRMLFELIGFILNTDAEIMDMQPQGPIKESLAQPYRVSLI